MKRFLAVLMFLAVPAFAQKAPAKKPIGRRPQGQLRATLTSHGTILTWMPPAVLPPTLTGYNVFSAPCTGTFTLGAGQPTNAPASGTCSAVGSFAQIAGNVAGLTYTDSSPQPGQTIVYQVTAQCPAAGACVGQGAPSNQVAGNWPGIPPGAPTLSIQVAKATVTGNKETISAAWTETIAPGFIIPETAYQIWGNGKILQDSVCFLAACNASWSGTTVNAPWVTVTDSLGNHTASKAGTS